jgi:4-hydroxythreonine-4-phosphate dehydrogenase
VTPIAVSMGDPAGVGPELCLRLLADPDLGPRCLVVGDLAVLHAVARACDLPPPTGRVHDLGRLSPADFAPGRVSAACGAASHAYVLAALDLALSRQAAAVCTGPIHKEAWAAAGVPFPGHTELLAHHTNADRHVMMLTSEAVTCSLVTAHVGLREVPGLLSVGAVWTALDLTADAMRRLRGREPRLAVCGLNPHAGENGLFGDREEERFVTPAIQRARAMGLDVAGPLPPDTAFLPARRAVTDAYVCLYHDQGLIPLKALAFDEAVNVTLGLPVVRTSVDHGTAFDIAWQGKASPGSLLAAVRLAGRLSGGPAAG